MIFLSILLARLADLESVSGLMRNALAAEDRDPYVTLKFYAAFANAWRKVQANAAYLKLDDGSRKELNKIGGLLYKLETAYKP